MPAVALGPGIVAGAHRHILVVYLVGDYPDAGPRRIDAAVPRLGVKRRAGHFAGATTGALFDIDPDFLDRLRCDTGSHCYPPARAWIYFAVAAGSQAETPASAVRIPLRSRSSAA